MRYVIPSSRRADTLARRTLPLLKELGVDDSEIDVWVNPDQVDDYRAVTGVNIRVVDPPGRLTASRNAIAGGYARGTRLICMDDDVASISVGWRGRKLTPVDALRWGRITEWAWHQCDLLGLGMWAPYVVNNDFYMKPWATTDLRYASGGLWAYTVRGDATERVELDDKEDFERSVKFYLRDGGLLRLAWLSFDHWTYSGAGGMQDYRTDETVEQGARALAAMFPAVVRYRAPKRPGDHAEVDLRPAGGVCSPIPVPAWV